MLRSRLLLPALLALPVLAQESARSRLQPITAPIRRAGVYHVATGSWTRGASLANSPDYPAIYDNTCTPAYFVSMTSGETIQHRSRVPSPSGPRTPSVFYGDHLCESRFDEVPGCKDAYTVFGFEIAYCSSHVGTIDWQHDFASSYADCGGSDMVPESGFTLTGLPGGTSSGASACWIVDVDLTGLPGGGMTLTADGDGTYDGPSTADQFGWSFGIASSSTITAADFTGPLQAGNYTWTNGGMQSPCAGSDGTAFGWDLPIHPGPGTGMSSNDFFRLTGPAVASPGCYAFGTLHSDFYLKLFAVPDCPVSDPIVKFCAPGVGGIHSCPCGNPQVPAGAAKGCNNFAGGGTGGAVLSYGGIASLGNDTLFIHMTAGLPGVVSVLFQGTTNTVNTRSGAGLRCVGGILERLYKANLSADGSICFQQDDVRVHDASAAHGFPISAPITLFYYAAYRNSAANGHPGCPGLDFGFNTSNAVSIAWAP